MNSIMLSRVKSQPVFKGDFYSIKYGRIFCIFCCKFVNEIEGEKDA